MAVIVFLLLRRKRERYRDGGKLHSVSTSLFISLRLVERACEFLTPRKKKKPGTSKLLKKALLITQNLSTRIDDRLL